MVEKRLSGRDHHCRELVTKCENDMHGSERRAIETIRAVMAAPHIHNFSAVIFYLFSPQKVEPPRSTKFDSTLLSTRA